MALVACYRFNNNTLDASGNVRHMRGGSPVFAAGLFGLALASSSGLMASGSGPFTGPVVGSGAASSVGYWIFQTDPGAGTGREMQIALADAGFQSIPFNTVWAPSGGMDAFWLVAHDLDNPGEAPEFGVWHHVVCVADNGSVILYIDAVEQERLDGLTDLEEYSPSHVVQVQITPGDNVFLLDMVTFWDHALSPGEVSSEYNGGAGVEHGSSSEDGTVAEQTFTTPGPDTWTPPPGVITATFETGGGGGGGGGGSDTTGGGGGGEGGYSSDDMTVTPGVPVNLVIGAGGAAGGVDLDGEPGLASSADTGGDSVSADGGSQGGSGTNGGGGGGGGTGEDITGNGGGTGDGGSGGAGGSGASEAGDGGAGGNPSPGGTAGSSSGNNGFVRVTWIEPPSGPSIPVVMSHRRQQEMS